MIEANDTYDKRALSISEAANYACVSRSTVENWLNRRLIPFEELPGRKGKYRFRRIRKSDLDRFLNDSYSDGDDHISDEKLIILPRTT